MVARCSLQMAWEMADSTAWVVVSVVIEARFLAPDHRSVLGDAGLYSGPHV